ncbi:gustatory receptor 23a-like [Ischnura elegans]|uniref:gustatory receptor 23a-like n=1 Tax=Ischnura elegans TaxID=197161 RepID=UPI001ED8A7C9|nr:gustatory receptor 23a-like [Ischnura elegans]
MLQNLEMAAEYLDGFMHLSFSYSMQKEECQMRKKITKGIVARAYRDQYNIQLSLFYQQLLHTSRPMDSKGFFVLNYRFLTSVTAVIITYIFILLQFQQYTKDTSSIFDINRVYQEF